MRPAMMCIIPNAIPPPLANAHSAGGKIGLGLRYRVLNPTRANLRNRKYPRPTPILPVLPARPVKRSNKHPASPSFSLLRRRLLSLNEPRIAFPLFTASPFLCIPLSRCVYYLLPLASPRLCVDDPPSPFLTPVPLRRRPEPRPT
jgi:hypothetical protein